MNYKKKLETAVLKGVNILLLILGPLFLAACAANIETGIKEAEKVASFNSFEKKLVPAGSFVLTTYQRITDKYSPYIVYIEGDGSIASGHYAIARILPLLK